MSHSAVRVIACLVVALAVVALPGYAEAIFFSGELSDDDVDLEYFDATVEWEYSELDALLAMTITNQTVSPFDYTISDLRFNTSNDVYWMFLASNPSDPLRNDDFPGASLDFLTNNAGSFGVFDWELDFGSGNSGLAEGNATTFYFYVFGYNVTNADFFSHLSWSCPEGYLANMHFTRGPGDDSAWAVPGAPPTIPPAPITVVPEPASLLLFGLGLAALGLRRVHA